MHILRDDGILSQENDDNIVNAMSPGNIFEEEWLPSQVKGLKSCSALMRNPPAIMNASDCKAIDQIGHLVDRSKKRQGEQTNGTQNNKQITKEPTNVVTVRLSREQTTEPEAVTPTMAARSLRNTIVPGIDHERPSNTQSVTRPSASTRPAEGSFHMSGYTTPSDVTRQKDERSRNQKARDLLTGQLPDPSWPNLENGDNLIDLNLFDSSVSKESLNASHWEELRQIEPGLVWGGDTTPWELGSFLPSSYLAEALNPSQAVLDEKAAKMHDILCDHFKKSQLGQMPRGPGMDFSGPSFPEDNCVNPPSKILCPYKITQGHVCNNLTTCPFEHDEFNQEVTCKVPLICPNWLSKSRYDDCTERNAEDRRGKCTLGFAHEWADHLEAKLSKFELMIVSEGCMPGYIRLQKMRAARGMEPLPWE